MAWERCIINVLFRSFLNSFAIRFDLLRKWKLYSTSCFYCRDIYKVWLRNPTEWYIYSKSNVLMNSWMFAAYICQSININTFLHPGEMVLPWRWHSSTLSTSFILKNCCVWWWLMDDSQQYRYKYMKYMNINILLPTYCIQAVQDTYLQ